MNVVLEAALAAWDAGISVAPATTNGTKRPRTFPIPPDCEHPKCIAKRERCRAEERAEVGWVHLQHARLRRDAVERYFARAHGLCVITGAISGNLLLLETDTPDIADQLRTAAHAAGAGGLVDRLDAGYLELSPSGGTHWLLRLDGTVDGSTPLARRPKLASERKDDDDTSLQVLIETRGEGGQAVVAPSGGQTHPSGRSYELLTGGFDTIPTLTADEWQQLVDVARTFDQMPARPTPAPRPPRPPRTPDDDESPMEWFNREATWREILEPAGWVLVDDHGANHAWRHAGAHAEQSATVNDHGDGALYVFTSSTAFAPGEAYSKFRAYAVLHHNDDMSAAGRHLAAWRRARATA